MNVCQEIQTKAPLIMSGAFILMSDFVTAIYDSCVVLRTPHIRSFKQTLSVTLIPVIQCHYSL
jgi:hypothetical protein